MPIFSHMPLRRSSGLRLLRAVWRSEAGNALYATMLLIPVGMGIVGAGVDGLYWYQAREALHKSAFNASKAAYDAYNAGTEMDDAARLALEENQDRYGSIQSLSVSIATDADRKAADLHVSTKLILPITSKLFGFVTFIETNAASDEETTASVMAGVKPQDGSEGETTEAAMSDESGESGSLSSGSTSDPGASSQREPHVPPPVITETRDRFAPEILRNSKVPEKMTD